MTAPVLTREQLKAFAVHGYLVVRGVVPDWLLEAADAEVDGRVAAAPPADDAKGQHFYFEPGDQLPAADAALREYPKLRALAEEVS